MDLPTPICRGTRQVCGTITIFLWRELAYAIAASAFHAAARQFCVASRIQLASALSEETVFTSTTRAVKLTVSKCMTVSYYASAGP